MPHKSKSPRTLKRAMDVAVVLGAAVWQGGIPSPSLRRRVLHGTHLVRSGLANWLILSGGVGQHPPSEAQVMQSLALEQGIGEERIILDEASTSTFESAVVCSRIMNSRGFSSAWVVSDRYHLLRSVFLFRRLGIDARGSAPGRRGTGVRKWRWYYLYLRESVALPWCMLKLFCFKWRKIIDGQS